jgi:uncharacterized protein
MAMVRKLAAGLILTLTWLMTTAVAGAQGLEGPGERGKTAAVGVLSRGSDESSIRMINDLVTVLYGESFRVMPVVGRGPVPNIGDILYMKGIDAAIVPTDVLAYLRRARLYPEAENSIRYIAKLYDEELHVLARRDIASIADLAGKPVNVDARGSGTNVTASLVFDALQVRIEPTSFEQPVALEMLKRGEIAALVYVTGKPARLFYDLNQQDGLHFLPVPRTPELLRTYVPARLGIEDYPLLIGSGEAGRGQPIETVAVSAVMAIYNWAPGSDRYRAASQFCTAFFRNVAALQIPPRHPKWKEVDLTAEVPGWQRFGPAEAWIAGAPEASGAPTTRERRERSPPERTPSQASDPWFQEFRRWQPQGR